MDSWIFTQERTVVKIIRAALSTWCLLSSGDKSSGGDMGVFGIIATGWRRLFRTPWLPLEPCQARVLGEDEEERQGLVQAEGRLQGDRQSPRQRLTAIPVQNRHQVYKPAGQTDVGDIDTPNGSRLRDLHPAPQVRVDLMMGLGL